MNIPESLLCVSQKEMEISELRPGALFKITHTGTALIHDLNNGHPVPIVTADLYMLVDNKGRGPFQAINLRTGEICTNCGYGTVPVLAVEIVAPSAS